MTATLELPTEGEVRAACKRYDRENQLADQALTELMRQYPHNSDASHVLLKVVAVNSLCHTSLFDVVSVARHIHAHCEEIDLALAAGSPEIVNLIAKVKLQGKSFCFLAFASKYCGWHNPAAYPIYDSHIDAYLWNLHKHSHFASFQHNDLFEYAKFLKVVADFRDFYGLSAFGFKELDKFLSLQGAPRAIELPDEQPCGPGTFDFFPAVQEQLS